ncbi:MAG: MGMT family protein [Armatimonadetes bacterium]|nr:MGMT family protein [Armatimonadota bacterium]
MKSSKKTNLYDRIFEIVNLIPAGSVATYGQIAHLVGCSPRVVGYAMHSVSAEDDVPWQRVINSKGKISFPEGYDEQKAILEAEGVVFDKMGKIDLKKFGWAG